MLMNVLSSPIDDVRSRDKYTQCAPSLFITVDTGKALGPTRSTSSRQERLDNGSSKVGKGKL
jgi:hypothetical protein